MRNNQKTLIEIGILAIALVVLVSGCVEEKSQLTEEQAIKLANDSEHVKSLFELYSGVTIDGGKVEVKIKEVRELKHYDIIYILDNGTNITNHAFAFSDSPPKPSKTFSPGPCSAGLGCPPEPEWYSHIKDIEVVELATAHLIGYGINDILMRWVCVDNSTYGYRNETVYIYQQDCPAVYNKSKEHLCSKYEHYCNTDDNCVGYIWRNECMDGIGGEECRNTFRGAMPISAGNCMFYEKSNNCYCINNTCNTLKKKSQQEQKCMDSGGVVSTILCCDNISDFPNTCNIGICDCDPEHSHQIKTCICRKNKCFNGIKCTLSF